MPIWAYFAIYLACAFGMGVLIGHVLRGNDVPQEEPSYPCEPEPIRARRLREREPVR